MELNSGNFKSDSETERILNGNTKIFIKWYIDNL